MPQPAAPSPSPSPTRATEKIVVVLGKETVHRDEHDALVDIGRAIAARNLTLYTTQSKGAPALVAEGYTAITGRPPIWTTKRNWPERPAEVIVFTDNRYVAQLTERNPDWRDNGWLVIHNRKATQDFAKMCLQILTELGTELDSGKEDGQ